MKIKTRLIVRLIQEVQHRYKLESHTDTLRFMLNDLEELEIPIDDVGLGLGDHDDLKMYFKEGADGKKNNKV